MREGREQLVAIQQLQVGERFVVRPGDKLATDGVIEEGESAVDASMLTGEPVPVEVSAGAPVAGGTINTYGRLVVRATQVGSETALAQIARLVRDAQAGKAPVQRLADRVSAVFVPCVIGISLLTLAGWLLSGAGAAVAFSAAVAVIVIACPCALGLATPTALMVGVGRGAQLGIVIRGPEVLERTRLVTTVVLDKTGTLTRGRMAVSSVVAQYGVEQAELMRLAAGAEDGSGHPIARAIVRHAHERIGAALPRAETFTSRTGLGVQAVVDGRAIAIGRPTLLKQMDITLPDELIADTERLEASGDTVVAVAWDGAARGLIALSDQIKPGSVAALTELRALGLSPVLLTGDNERAARAVAEQVGIERVIAGVMPAEKASEITRLQEHGAVVAMVGDGVNDAPALAQADLGIATGTGTDVAIEASDLTLVSGDLHVAADAIRLARATLGHHHQGQPLLGIRLQRGGDSARRRGRGQPGGRCRCNVILERVRGRQLAAAAPLPTKGMTLLDQETGHLTGARLRRRQGCAGQAPAQERRQGARNREDAGGGSLLRRRHHTDLSCHDGARSLVAFQDPR